MAKPTMPIGSWGQITSWERSDKPGTWRASARVRDPDGVCRKVTATGSTKRQAEQDLQRVLLARVSNSRAMGARQQRVHDIAETWLNDLRVEAAIETTTINGYARDVSNLLCAPKTGIGGLFVHEVTAGVAQQFIDRQVTESSRKRAKHVLGQVMDCAVRHELISHNPARSTKRLRRTKREVQVLSIDQLSAVRAAVKEWTTRSRPGPRATDDMADIIDMMLATGCRIGEVLALRWCDVDLAAEAPTVLITGTIKTETGRGTYRKPSPKTAAGVRRIVLPPFAVEVLLRRGVNQPANDIDAVFATRNGTWFQTSGINRRWRTIRQDTGLEWVTPHTFRKTVATMIDREFDAKTASRVLGHSSESITEAHYIRRSDLAPDVSDVLQRFGGAGD